VAGVHKLEGLARAHVEVMKGRVEHSVAYCSKDGKFEEYGVKPMDQRAKGQCEIDRYEAAYDAAVNGNLDDIPKDIYVRHYGALQKIAVANMKEPPSRDVLENYWIFGPSGCGKSKGALLEYGKRAFLKKCDNKWWDGYQPAIHDVVIIEDICPKQAYQMTNLKIWSDHRAFSAETKGGIILIRPKILVVTANHSIDEVFADDKEATEEDVRAIHRRFTVIDMYKGTMSKPAIERCPDKFADVVAFLHGGLVPFDRTEPPQKRIRLTVSKPSTPKELVPWEVPTDDPALVFNNFKPFAGYVAGPREPEWLSEMDPCEGHEYEMEKSI